MEKSNIYRSRAPIWVRAMHTTLRDWVSRGTLYRMFHNFYDLYDKHHKDFIKHAYNYAPYNIGGVCGQLVPVTFDKINVVEVEELSDTERGTGGFGSTDKQFSGKKPKVKGKKFKKIDKKLSETVKDM